MKRFRCWLQRVGLAAMVVGVGAGARAQGSGYTLQELGHPGGGRSWAFGISGSHVVGSSEAAGMGVERACLWSAMALQELVSMAGDPLAHPPAAGTRVPGSAYGVNGAGQVVGFSETRSGATHAFLWMDRGSRDLGTLGGADSFAYAINAAGQVAGAAVTAGGQTHAFRWDRGGMRDLGTLGGHFSTAVALDDAGRVAGSAETAGGPIHAFRWTNGEMRDLGTLGGHRSHATGINHAGWIVGSSEAADGRLRAFLWTGRLMRDLGTLGGRESDADGINDAGQIVGAAETADGRRHAFLYTRAAGMIDLNQRIDPARGWELVQAQAVSASGQIIGWGRHHGREGAFLLSPAGDRVANRR